MLCQQRSRIDTVFHQVFSSRESLRNDSSCKVKGYRLQSVMIESIRHKGLKRFYEKDNRSAVSANMVARIEEILAILEALRQSRKLISRAIASIL